MQEKRCPDCGNRHPRRLANCPKCGREFSLREIFPEHYKHERIGEVVQVVQNGKVIASGTITRVLPSRFGLLAELDGNGETLYRLTECVPAVGT